MSVTNISNNVYQCINKAKPMGEFSAHLMSASEFNFCYWSHLPKYYISLCRITLKNPSKKLTFFFQNDLKSLFVWFSYSQWDMDLRNKNPFHDGLSLSDATSKMHEAGSFAITNIVFRGWLSADAPQRSATSVTLISFRMDWRNYANAPT